ncbi:GumC family protein [Enterovirga rhinocerotis]|uniref:Uncharacterized protein involved in exopolysaccharide biosynthesis n=1 Tax=Enterovirga rhinocerotis TaxID=1339210 RepID=A0A4R7CDA9_9HYPH|nr:exopolysaccharide transport family protein [Enterovirga rhinocerotis]TDR94817.1 uncharacterized protein involved in exopolysaccharide biosynthesis [Enterovirga rhinocerotis]
MTQSFVASTSDDRPASSEATVADVGRALIRKWRWVVLPTLAAMIASAAYVFTVTPRYTGEAKILLQTSDSTFTRPGPGDRAPDQSPQIDEQAVASQVQVVMSRDLAREAIRRLGLVGNAEFDPQSGSKGIVQTIKETLGLTKSGPERAPEDRVLDAYYRSLLVYPVGKSRIVAIEFRSQDPDLAARGANTVAEIYLGRQEDTKKDQARSASSWLGSNVESLRKRVAEAEAKVEAFRAKTGLLAGSGTTTLSAQQLSELSAQLAQARATRSDTQAKAKLIRDALREGRAFDIPDVANNELIRRLLEQRVSLKAQLALELRTLMPQHPRIKELNAQLADLEQQIRLAAERTVRTLENDAKIAGSRVEALEAAIESQKKIVAEANANEVELRALEREARILREQLESYLGRYRDAAARDADFGVPPDARVISHAVVPQIPSFPKKLPIIALSTLAMFLLCVGAIVSRELLTSYRPEEREQAGALLPYQRVARAASPRSEPDADFELDLGPVTRSDATHRGPVLDMRPEARVDAIDAPDPNYDFAALVERVSRTPIAGRGRRLLVTGIGGRDDVERVSRGLGQTLARSTRTILISIDADESTPIDAHLGLTDLVAGEASFSDVIMRDAGSALYRIEPGTLLNEAITGSPESLDVALQALDSTYGWIVCALVGRDDRQLTKLIAPRVDAVVLASDLDPSSPILVGAYEDLQTAGGKDVIVASAQYGQYSQAA